MIRIATCGLPGSNLPFSIEHNSRRFPEPPSELSPTIWPSMVGFHFDAIVALASGTTGGQFQMVLGKGETIPVNPVAFSEVLILAADGHGGWELHPRGSSSLITQIYFNVPWNCANAPPYNLHIEHLSSQDFFNHRFDLTPLLDRVTACSG